MSINSSDIKYFTEFRHKLHATPELSYHEKQTSRLVCEELDRLGIEYDQGLAGTGIVAWIKKGNSSRSIALRADLDALPLTEASGVPYSSKNSGVMHACGHDGHTTMLLAAAKYIKESMEFDGTLYLIFQPAEEYGAGARRMIRDGLFEKYKIDKIFGLHNRPGEPFGKFFVKKGAVMSAVDTWSIRISGISAHSSQPHRAINPILVASHIVLAVKNISSQDIDPSKPHVVTVAKIESGTALNIIPDSCTIEGSVRVLDDKTQQTIENRIKKIATSIAESFGTTAEIKYCRDYPITKNSIVDTPLKAALATVGGKMVTTDFASSMGSEDFSFYLEHVLGCYVWLGATREGCEVIPLHSQKYDFDDGLLEIGAKYWINLTKEELGV